MTEELEQLLKNLKLRRMLEIYDEQLRAADKDDISYSEFVTRLVRAQFQARQEGALEWRIRRANLPERWSLETFPFARQPGVNRKQIRGFAELEFITKAENIVLVGETGRGKTGLACGLLLKALENGYRCQFVKAQDLFDEMYASLADRSSRQLLKRLARLDVLLIAEFGYLHLKPEQSNIFFKLMEERYRQQFADQRIDLAQAQRQLRISFQVAAHEAVLTGAHFERGGAGIVDAGDAVFIGQRQHAQNAAHRGLALLAVHAAAERADLLA